jgi:hypothetical protein
MDTQNMDRERYSRVYKIELASRGWEDEGVMARVRVKGKGKGKG